MEYSLNKEGCKITRNGEILVVGDRHHYLYKLLLRVVQPIAPATVCVASKVDTLQSWHERLCHQNKQYVEKYLRKHGISFVKDNQFCEGCVLGKQHRLSFGTRVNGSNSPGELVHADVCGPMQVDSFKGYRYFVNFKDDFSKYRSVFFLKKKSEVAEKLKQFLAIVSNLGHMV